MSLHSLHDNEHNMSVFVKQDINCFTVLIARVIYIIFIYFNSIFCSLAYDCFHPWCQNQMSSMRCLYEISGQRPADKQVERSLQRKRT